MNVLSDLYGQSHDDAYARMQRGVEARARRRAGQALSGGDHQKASGELYDAGMLDAGAGVQRMATDAEDRQLGLEKDRRGMELQAMKQKGDALIRVSTALQHVEPGQRLPTLQKILPVLGEAMDVSPFQSLTEADLTDDNLRMFGAEIASKIKTYSSGGRTVAVNEGALQRDFDDPSAVRVLDEDPLARELLEARTAATEAQVGQRAASAEASRARAYRTRNPISRAKKSGKSTGQWEAF